MFGTTQNPNVLGVSVKIELLSPAQRPLSITQDLPFFWKEAYPEVKKKCEAVIKWRRHGYNRLLNGRVIYRGFAFSELATSLLISQCFFSHAKGDSKILDGIYVCFLWQYDSFYWNPEH